jgi:DNA-binding transcriptional regulator PaaX
MHARNDDMHRAITVALKDCSLSVASICADTGYDGIQVRATLYQMESEGTAERVKYGNFSGWQLTTNQMKDAQTLAEIRYDAIFGRMKNAVDSYHKGLLTDEEFAHEMGMYRDELISVECKTIVNYHRVSEPVRAVND